MPVWNLLMAKNTIQFQLGLLLLLKSPSLEFPSLPFNISDCWLSVPLRKPDCTMISVFSKSTNMNTVIFSLVSESQHFANQVIILLFCLVQHYQFNSNLSLMFCLVLWTTCPRILMNTSANLGNVPHYTAV